MAAKEAAAARRAKAWAEAKAKAAEEAKAIEAARKAAQEQAEAEEAAKVQKNVDAMAALRKRLEDQRRAALFGASAPLTDTDRSGGNGLLNRVGATSLKAGYSSTLRGTKNDDVLDHGEYDDRSFADRVGRKAGGWNATQQNGDDLWDQVQYGDTDVAGGLSTDTKVPMTARGNQHAWRVQWRFTQEQERRRS